MREEKYPFISDYKDLRESAFQVISKFLQALPDDLSGVTLAFTQRLAYGTSMTKKFEDCFTDPNVARVVYLPWWIADAYIKDQKISEPFLKALFVSSFLGFCAIRIQDDFVDEDHPDLPREELLLANLFLIEAIQQLQNHFPAESSLWDSYKTYWHEFTVK